MLILTLSGNKLFITAFNASRCLCCGRSNASIESAVVARCFSVSDTRILFWRLMRQKERVVLSSSSLNEDFKNYGVCVKADARRQIIGSEIDHESVEFGDGMGVVSLFERLVEVLT